ncbi:MAG TPA: hypothetical protein VII57_04325 [Dehalococcoidia bacterium]
MSFEATLLVAGIGGGAGVFAAALALGIRHGIDWDHIAAITDITSASASVSEEGESWLIAEPGVMLTDESHHSQHGPHSEHELAHAMGEAHEHIEVAAGRGGAATLVRARPSTGVHVILNRMPRAHREAVWLGSLYALGHGAVVVLLGVVAILAREILPDWIDPVMERVVGVTLVFLAVYLFFSLYQYFRGGGEFRIRSRWMLVFAGMANAWGWVRSRVGQHEHVHAAPRSYTARAAVGIGLIHGIGAETGTQALIIATAVGATSKGVAIAALFCFVLGLLISNTFVTLASTFGFVSARRRQAIYVAAGFVAAVFSLILGLVFISASTGILPDTDPYFRWVGGPD